MGFLYGRVSFERFSVGGKEFREFDQKHVDSLDEHASGKKGSLTADGVEVGFSGGDHILDVDFRVEKNIVNDALHFGVRVETNKLPSDLMRAYEFLELAGIIEAEGVENGQATRAHRASAKKAARDRLTDEASDGRFKRMRLTQALWDARSRTIYFGSGSLTTIDQFINLFKEAFSRRLERLTAGSIAANVAAASNKKRAYEDLEPSLFTGPSRKVAVDWVAGEYGSKDFLGNEFLLWLWRHTEKESEVVELDDDSEVTVMLTKTLTLQCPVSETGKETISHESPVTLPEAKRAVMSGKLPRKSGLTLNRHDEQYELTLNAESLSVSGAALPKLDSGAPGAERIDRVDQIRHLTETLDLLFSAFLKLRLSSQWEGELKKIRAWLKEE